jgi:hypothetical protein
VSVAEKILQNHYTLAHLLKKFMAIKNRSAIVAILVKTNAVNLFKRTKT